MGDFFLGWLAAGRNCGDRAMCSEFELVFFRELLEKYNLQDNKECK